MVDNHFSIFSPELIPLFSICGGVMFFFGFGGGLSVLVFPLGSFASWFKVVGIATFGAACFFTSSFILFLGCVFFYSVWTCLFLFCYGNFCSWNLLSVLVLLFMFNAFKKKVCSLFLVEFSWFLFVSNDVYMVVVTLNRKVLGFFLIGDKSVFRN